MCNLKQKIDQSNPNDIRCLFSEVEKADKKIQKVFLDKIPKMKILSWKNYQEDSYEVRIIKMALSVYDSDEEKERFFNKISLTIQNETDRLQYHFILSVSNSFEKKIRNNSNEEKSISTRLNKLFKDYDSLNDSFKKKLHIGNNNININFEEKYLLYYIRECYINQKRADAYQYLYYHFILGSDLNLFKIKKLEFELNDLIDILYENGIIISEFNTISSLQRYFNNIPWDELHLSIREWADNDEEKKKYLSQNGVIFKPDGLEEYLQKIGKKLVSIEESSTDKDKKISELELRIKELERQIELANNKTASALSTDQKEESNGTIKIAIAPNNNIIPKHNSYSEAIIEAVSNNNLSKEEMYEAQAEAQKQLMQEFPNWTYPNNYGECDDNGKPYNYTTVKVKDEAGNRIPIVLKSYKKTDEPFKINTEEWDYIIKERADLLVYTGDDIKMIFVQDLIRNQHSIALSFSTENLDIEERIDAFSEALHCFKELHFDFDSFNISKNAQSVADIYKKNKRTLINNHNSEDDL